MNLYVANLVKFSGIKAFSDFFLDSMLFFWSFLSVLSLMSAYCGYSCHAGVANKQKDPQSFLYYSVSLKWGMMNQIQRMSARPAHTSRTPQITLAAR